MCVCVMKRYIPNKTFDKSEAVPLQARWGPGGSRKLRFPDFGTKAQVGGRLSALRAGRFTPRKYSWYSFMLEAESTPGPLWHHGPL